MLLNTIDKNQFIIESVFISFFFLYFRMGDRNSNINEYFYL